MKIARGRSTFAHHLAALVDIMSFAKAAAQGSQVGDGVASVSRSHRTYRPTHQPYNKQNDCKNSIFHDVISPWLLANNRLHQGFAIGFLVLPTTAFIYTNNRTIFSEFQVGICHDLLLLISLGLWRMYNLQLGGHHPICDSLPEIAVSIKRYILKLAAKKIRFNVPLDVLKAGSVKVASSRPAHQYP